MSFQEPTLAEVELPEAGTVTFRHRKSTYFLRCHRPGLWEAGSVGGRAVPIGYLNSVGNGWTFSTVDNVMSKPEDDWRQATANGLKLR